MASYCNQLDHISRLQHFTYVIVMGNFACAWFQVMPFDRFHVLNQTKWYMKMKFGDLKWIMTNFHRVYMSRHLQHRTRRVILRGIWFYIWLPFHVIVTQTFTQRMPHCHIWPEFHLKVYLDKVDIGHRYQLYVSSQGTLQNFYIWRYHDTVMQFVVDTSLAEYYMQVK